MENERSHKQRSVNSIWFFHLHDKIYAIFLLCKLQDFFFFRLSRKKGGRECSFTLCNYFFVIDQYIISFFKFFSFFIFIRKFLRSVSLPRENFIEKSLFKREIFIFLILNQTEFNCWSFVAHISYLPQTHLFINMEWKFSGSWS